MHQMVSEWSVNGQWIHLRLRLLNVTEYRLCSTGERDCQENERSIRLNLHALLRRGSFWWGFSKHIFWSFPSLSSSSLCSAVCRFCIVWLLGVTRVFVFTHCVCVGNSAMHQCYLKTQLYTLSVYISNRQTDTIKYRHTQQAQAQSFQNLHTIMLVPLCVIVSVTSFHFIWKT